MISCFQTKETTQYKNAIDLVIIFFFHIVSRSGIILAIIEVKDTFLREFSQLFKTGQTSLFGVHDSKVLNYYLAHGRHERHEGDTSETRASWVRHKCYKNGMSMTRVKNFDFDNDSSENIFSHHYFSYIANERLQEEEQFHSKNYLLDIPRSHAKIRLKSAQQKLNFVMAKVISKSYTLDCGCKCSCTFLYSYA